MLDKLKELLAEQLDADADSITMETSFKDDLEADSLDLFELVMQIEEDYDIEIDSEKLQDIKTVGDIVNFLQDTYPDKFA